MAMTGVGTINQEREPSLAEKLEFYRARSRLSAKVVAAHQLEGIGVERGRYLRNCHFECGVSPNSPVIGAAVGEVFWGAYSYMNDGGYVRGPLFVGRYCSIGRRVTIGAGMHSMTGVSTHPMLKFGAARPHLRRSTRKFTVIGSDVWIGDGAIVLPGVEIGTGAVIGANAVVTRDVAPYQVVAGVPARVLRKRLDEDQSDALLWSQWWELSKDVLTGMNLSDPAQFILELAELQAEALSNRFPTYILGEA